MHALHTHLPLLAVIHSVDHNGLYEAKVSQETEEERKVSFLSNEK